MAASTFRSVWITGASSGIGRALALLFADEGATVFATARTEQDLDRLAAEVSGPGRIVPLVCDVTDGDAVAAAFAELLKANSDAPPDLFIAGAGTHRPVKGLDLDPGMFRTLLEVNVMGVVNCLSCALPAMKEAGGGSVAVVSSVAGYRGLPSAAAYGATKAALTNMTEALRFDARKSGIRLQLVSPGFVRTPLTEKNPFPMPALLEPEDAARRIRRGLECDKFEIAFPWRFVIWLKLLRLLPYRFYFPLVRRITGW